MQFTYRKGTVNLTGKEASPVETSELTPVTKSLSVKGSAVPKRLF